MFGWINDCTESLVLNKFGIEKWHEIKAKAGCKVEDGGFIRHQYYSDGSTVSLVVAASEVLGITVDQVLEAFGQYFMEFTRQNGYVNLLSCQGSTLRLWLSNLNALHDHLQSSLPEGFVAPVFWCEDDEIVEGAILLHYYSKRGNLLVPLVVGVVKEVARYHFNLSVELTRIRMQDENDAKFTTWSISTTDPSLQWKLKSKHEVTSTSASLQNQEDSTQTNEHKEQSFHGCPFHQMGMEMKNRKHEATGTITTSPPSSDHQIKGVRFGSVTDVDMSTSSVKKNSSIVPIVPMSGDKMKEVFPYHVIVDDDFQVLQVGDSLVKLLSINPKKFVGNSISDILQITRPVLGSWDWSCLSKIEDQTFFLEPSNPNDIKIKLKGNIIHLSSDPKQVMFVLSPDAKNVSELRNMQLTFSDLPLSSFQRDAVFLGEHISSEVKSAHKLDKLSKKLANERNLSHALLYSMLPPHVADLLRQGQAFEPVSHENMTLFFSDVVGFTEMCAGLDPWDVIDMLNQLYSVMDHLAKKFNLYKVETIGDAYMCCSGVIEENENHAQDVADFAIAVRECVKLVMSPLTGDPIRLRIGIHSGACMSGVVGTLTPHYCLFGDMVNTTSRHESTGEADKIHTSSVFYGKIVHFSDHPEYFQFEPRGLVDMKGKGSMYTYWLNTSDLNPRTGPEALKELYDEIKLMLSTKERIWKKRSYFRKMRNSLSLSDASGDTQFIDLETSRGLDEEEDK